MPLVLERVPPCIPYLPIFLLVNSLLFVWVKGRCTEMLPGDGRKESSLFLNIVASQLLKKDCTQELHVFLFTLFEERLQ